MSAAGTGQAHQQDNEQLATVQQGSGEVSWDSVTVNLVTMHESGIMNLLA